MVVVWFVGFGLFAGFIPPPDPGMTPDDVARMYATNTDLLRVGLILTALVSPLLMPFTAAIAAQMKRIEGRCSPFAYAEIGLGAILVVSFIFPIMIFETASYRPERPAEVTAALNDTGWVMFIGVVSNAALQLVLLGILILMDKKSEPVFPRWCAYLNLWIGMLLIPGSVIVFFKDGPLAWNGLFTWWVPAASFGIWLGIMTYLLLKSAKRQEGLEQNGEDPEELSRELEQLRVRIASLSRS